MIHYVTNYGRQVRFYIYQCKKKWEIFFTIAFLTLDLVGNNIFSWWSAIGRPAELLKYSAIQFLDYVNQK